MTAASTITTVPAGNLAATDVQAALDELDTEKVAVASAKASGTTVVFAARVTGDSFDRTQILADGSLVMGSGTAAPSTKFWIDPTAGLAVQKNSGSGAASIDLYSASASTFSSFVVRRSGGTVAAPTAVQQFYTIGAFTFYGHNGTAFDDCATVTAYATENWTTSAQGTAFNWANVITGTTALGTRVTLYDRVLAIGTSPSSAPNTNERLRVNAPTTIDTAATAHVVPSATSAKGLVVQSLASQTANPVEVQTSAGTAVASISPTGAITAASVVAPIIQNAQTGTTYTPVLGDAGKLVELSNTSAITLTVPPNSSVAYPVGTQINLLQTNTGQVTVAPGSGVTVNAAPGLKLTDRWSAATLIKRATDTWVLTGRLSA